MKLPKRITLVFGIFVISAAVIVCFYTFRDIITTSLFPEEDISREVSDPYDDWLPFAIDNPTQEMSWLAPYSQSPQAADLASASNQTDISDTDRETELYEEANDNVEEYKEDNQEDYLADGIPEGYPEKLVPVYEPEFFSQSGFNDDENSYFVYFDCSKSYKAAVDFYRSTFSDKPHYSEDADPDALTFHCEIPGWSVKVKVCNFYDEASCYVEIDLIAVQ